MLPKTYNFHAQLIINIYNYVNTKAHAYIKFLKLNN